MTGISFYVCNAFSYRDIIIFFLWEDIIADILDNPRVLHMSLSVIGHMCGKVSFADDICHLINNP